MLVAVTGVSAFAHMPEVWTLTPRGIAAVAYAVVLASALCYVLIAWASQHLDPSYVSPNKSATK